jgi:hypothetical protein
LWRFVVVLADHPHRSLQARWGLLGEPAHLWLRPHPHRRAGSLRPATSRVAEWRRSILDCVKLARSSATRFASSTCASFSAWRDGSSARHQRVSDAPVLEHDDSIFVSVHPAIPIAANNRLLMPESESKTLLSARDCARHLHDSPSLDPRPSKSGAWTCSYFLRDVRLSRCAGLVRNRPETKQHEADDDKRQNSR